MICRVIYWFADEGDQDELKIKRILFACLMVNSFTANKIYKSCIKHEIRHPKPIVAWENFFQDN